MGSELHVSPTPHLDAIKEEPTRSFSPPSSPLAVAATRQVEPEDEWAGLGDRQERRRRQNRLNQRAYRKRKQAERGVVARSKTGSRSNEQSSSSQSSPGDDSNSNANPSPTDQALCTRRPSSFDPSRRPQTVQALLERFSQVAMENYIRGSPASDHLLTLTKLNVFRAFVSNMSALGMGMDDDWCHDDDALSLFNTKPLGSIDESSMPLHLRPTKLQVKIPHHPWLDFFPLPRMRDNLVEVSDRFDDEELCMDIMGFWEHGTDSCSMLVWGEPTDPANWEVTEKFLRKWPWVIRGCPELLQSTNRWRQQRGEKMLIRYL
ncbi:hypothetical protein BO70DRAFT_338393 [Aspergillus heteromorphus CBS 117.55]|uniref:BZIP domain-containing protein n=1 Tax=Aspergillus heteromorphus CBS 117.55 TaxID=1448321 RepID=A0A317W512_9EURO|nr:uncharacterized protein BO70DRAFT_338393 [Aspergillus heteromorphus CBS 117.55]PWY79220.1 hypothetical protein BO70DRAFT_338393 [Aspergillus heteromorphus CBS 117.55]